MITEVKNSKEHPIIFSQSMVRALLEGRKTQTRRIIKPQPIVDEDSGSVFDGKHRKKYDIHNWKNRFIDDFSRWIPEDVLWVRETFWYNHLGPSEYLYKTDNPDLPINWKPSIFMPKEAARIFLEITNVRVERLHDINRDDAIAEGVEPYTYSGRSSFTAYKDYLERVPQSQDDILNPIGSYKSLWEKINGLGSWDNNPFVWVIEFKNISK